MIGNESIYPEIGKVLFEEAPNGSQKVMMTAFDLSDSGSACSFKFHSIDKENRKSWFIPKSLVATEKLTDHIYDLRMSYINNGQPAWSECIFILDLQTGKFEMELKYPD